MRCGDGELTWAMTWNGASWRNGELGAAFYGKGGCYGARKKKKWAWNIVNGKLTQNLPDKPRRDITVI